jgi:transcriptional regulator GlxA family with amidase domain
LLALPHDEVIQEAIGIIQQYDWDQLTLEWVADKVGLSKYCFSHRFTGVTGVSFRDHLAAVRLEKAKELLPVRGLSVTQVAQTVGFCDLPRFDKLFKRCTGLTPSAYRALPRLVATND